MILNPNNNPQPQQPFTGIIDVVDAKVEQDIKDAISEFKEAGATKAELVQWDKKAAIAQIEVTIPFGQDEFRRRLEALGGTPL